MNPDHRLAQDLFARALEFPPGERAAFLTGACGSNLPLRHRVEALLAASEEATGFLPEDPSEKSATTVLQEASLTEEVGTQIGRYKLLEKLGEGGFGSVWAAEQKEPVRRRVALKIIKLGMDTQQVVARFEAERQALAMMDHPNIAKVLDAGATETGRPYFVMELVKGIAITKYCTHENLPTGERLDLFIKVCQAIQHAHQKGIIHRDIKPSNIMVTLHDGVPVPKVIDFGIAKATQQELTEKTIYTQYSQFIGTPAYMSPEQAEMSGLDIDTRSDIYSLGVLLYELLTGATPFDSKELLNSGLEGMRKIIREREPIRPSTRLRQTQTVATSPEAVRVPRPTVLASDLDWIVMKCLEKDRARRYETANGLASDLRRHLDHEPIVARPPSTSYRLQMALRRHRLAFAAAGAVTAALVIGIAVSVWQARRAVHARDEAQRARQAEQDQTRKALEAQAQAEQAARKSREAEKAERDQREVADVRRRESQDRLVRMRVANGNRLAEQGDSLNALAWFVNALELDQADPVRVDMHRRRIEALLVRSPRIVQIWEEGTLIPFGFSPDGRACLTGVTTTNAIYKERSEIRLWDTSTGDLLLKPLAFDTRLQSAGFVPGNRSFYSVVGGELRVWDRTTGLPVSAAMPHQRYYNATPAFIPDGTRVLTVLTASGGDDYGNEDQVVVRDAVTGIPIGKPVPVRARVWSLEFLPGGQRFRVNMVDDAAGEFLVREYSVETGDPLATSGRTDARRTWPLGDWRVAYWESSDSLRIRDMRTGESSPPIQHRGMIYRPKFSPDGSRLGTPSYDGTVGLWDPKTGARLTPPLVHEHVVGVVNFSADGQRLISGSYDFTARVWDPRTGNPVGPPLPHSGTVVTTAELNGDGTRALVRSGNLLLLWNLAASEGEPRRLKHPEGASQMRFRPGTQELLTAGRDGSVRMWTLTQSTPRWDVGGHLGPVHSVAFTSDGRLAATAGEDGMVRLWDPETGRPVGIPLRHEVVVKHVEFSPDGRRLLAVCASNEGGDVERRIKAPSVESAVGTGGGRVRVWDLQQGKPEWDLVHPESLIVAHFNPNGGSIVTATDTGDLCVWSLRNDGLPRRLAEVLPWEVRSAEFSPDGRRVVVALLSGGSDPLMARVFDAETLVEVLSPLPHSDGVSYARYSPDGRRIGTAGEDHARIWDAETGAPISPPLRLRGQVRRLTFSPDNRMLIAVGDGGVAQVWDAASGEPVTPLLYDGDQKDQLDRVEACSDGVHFAVRDVEGGVHIWDLGQRKDLSLEQVLTRAKLLSSRQLDATETALEPIQPETVKALWTQWRGKPLDTLATPPSHRLTTHPRTQVAEVGTNVVFKVSVEPPVARFQWRHNGVEIAGATNDALQINGVSLKDAGNYVAEVRGTDATLPPAYSRAASLSLRQDGMLLGSLKRERYDSIRGLTVDRLTNNPAFPGSPSAVDSVGEFESPDLGRDHYGLRLSGYVIPPQSGDYEFVLAGDDQAVLFLSTDESPEHLRQIAFMSAWGNPRDWTPRGPSGPSANVSLPQSLVQGRRYFVEAWLKEESGGEHLSVAWRPPGARPLAEGDPPIPGSFLAFAEGPQGSRYLPQVSHGDGVNIDLLGSRARWSEALAVVGRALQAEPTNHVHYHRLAPLLVQVGDLEGYRKNCALEVERFGNTRDPNVAERLTKDCLILPESGANVDVLNAWTELAITQGQSSPDFPWFQFSKAFLEYRLGHYRPAAEWSRKVLSHARRDDVCRLDALMVLAMAHRKLGEVELARSAFAEAEKQAARLPTAESGDVGAEWLDWIIAQVLLQESRKVMNADR
ncbi:MAG: protein kinase [Verrucomicrobiales bacterium]|nr:protein kinase [Verrucomicrobiales bacterium]